MYGSRRFDGATKMLIGPDACIWDVVGWITVAKGTVIRLRRGMGVAGTRVGQVWADSSGKLDWSTLDTKWVL